MWNLLKKSDDECRKLQDLLEDSAAVRPEAASVEELSEVLSPAERTHIASCEQCRAAARDLLATREIFQRVGSASEVASTWLAVPKFAARLALVSGALLLVASTWLYERPSAVPAKQPAGAASQEYLFEAPQPPMNQDDVLISLAEQNQ